MTHIVTDATTVARRSVADSAMIAAGVPRALMLQFVCSWWLIDGLLDITVDGWRAIHVARCTVAHFEAKAGSLYVERCQYQALGVRLRVVAGLAGPSQLRPIADAPVHGASTGCTPWYFHANWGALSKDGKTALEIAQEKAHRFLVVRLIEYRPLGCSFLFTLFSHFTRNLCWQEMRYK